MSKPKLLLADDSITIQKVVNLTFADQGMDVFTFSDGDAAIENYDSIKPDIVLADVNMPGINGYQLCELLKSDAESSRVPVLLLVGSFEPFDRDEAERVGAAGHLTKPFTSIANLVSMVDQLLAPSAEPEHAADPEPQQVEELPPPAASPAADTSDIDHLYEQSFVETVEIPKDQEGNPGYHNDLLDDEMIQTSYAEADMGMPADDSYYVESDVDDLAAGEPVFDEPIADPIIAPSMHEFHEEPESAADEADYLGAGLDSDESADGPEAEDVTQPAEIKRTADPFESLAAEPPPVHFVEVTEPGPPVPDPDDMDLLELPVSGRGRTVEYTAPGQAGAQNQVAALSPELIDLIVDKVIERLAERSPSGEAQSATRS